MGKYRLVILPGSQQLLKNLIFLFLRVTDRVVERDCFCIHKIALSEVVALWFTPLLFMSHMTSFSVTFGD